MRATSSPHAVLPATRTLTRCMKKATTSFVPVESQAHHSRRCLSESRTSPKALGFLERATQSPRPQILVSQLLFTQPDCVLTAYKIRRNIRSQKKKRRLDESRAASFIQINLIWNKQSEVTFEGTHHRIIIPQDNRAVHESSTNKLTRRCTDNNDFHTAFPDHGNSTLVH